MLRTARPLTALLVLALCGVAEAKRPDLRATAITPVGYAHPGGDIAVSLTIKRSGTKKAVGARAYLSADAKRSKDDARLASTRLRGTVAALAGRVPAGTKARYVIACADDPSKLRERNERNNCRATPVTVLTEADASKTSQALIAADLAAGKIDGAHALVYRVMALRGDSKLPAKYAGDASAAEDDGVMREIADAWPTLPRTLRNQIKPDLQPGSAGRTTKAHAAQQTEEGGWCARTTQATTAYKTIPAAGGKALVHYEADRPEWAKPAAEAAAAVTAAWPRYKAIMGREPLSDSGGQCYDGGSGALDLYVTEGIARAVAVTMPSEMRQFYTPDCEANPTFILFETSSRSFSLKFTIAHELFHAFQYAYPYRDGCQPYGWFDEASANWAAHTVFPTDDSEHFFTALMDQPRYELGFYDYDDWPFVLWMQQRFGDASIRATYENFAKNDSLHAVSDAIGGLRKHYLDFAEQAWNQDPVPTFVQWDRYTPHPKNTDPVHLFLLDGQHERQAYVPANVSERARQYSPLAITDERVRELTFSNPLAGDPDFRVGAILTLAGGGWRFEDWSGKEQVKLCRDVPEQNVTSMVVVYANTAINPKWDEHHDIAGTPGLKLRDRCDDTWHFRVLAATLKTHADGSMSASSNDSLCGMIAGLPMHGQTNFTADSPGKAFTTDNDATIGDNGRLFAQIDVRAPSTFSFVMNGCKGITGPPPVTACSTSFDRPAGGDGTFTIGFTLDAESKQAQNATLNWWVSDPEVGSIDFSDETCNVQDLWHPLSSEATKQTVALSQFRGTQPFTLHFDSEAQFTQDALGRAASIAYDWTYDVTLQRVDETGRPLG